MSRSQVKKKNILLEYIMSVPCWPSLYCTANGIAKIIKKKPVRFFDYFEKRTGLSLGRKKRYTGRSNCILQKNDSAVGTPREWGEPKKQGKRNDDYRLSPRTLVHTARHLVFDCQESARCRITYLDETVGTFGAEVNQMTRSKIDRPDLPFQASEAEWTPAFSLRVGRNFLQPKSHSLLWNHHRTACSLR